jgi:hypothetical protein
MPGAATDARSCRYAPERRHEHRQRPGGLEERLLAVGSVGPFLAELDREPAQLGDTLRRVGAGQLQGRLDEGLGAEPRPPPGERALGRHPARRTARPACQARDRGPPCAAGAVRAR